MKIEIENPCYHCYAGAVGGYCMTCKSYKIGHCEIENPTIEVEESEAENLDNQRAVEDTEYCERHEPTYNSDDGSM